MGITKKQKEEICRLYSDMKPISDKQLDWCLRQSATYIYVDHQNTAFCTRCESKVMLPKTKHLAEVKCPNCNHTMKALHIWRRKPAAWNGLEGNRINWYVFPENFDEHTLMLRYVVVYRADTEPEYGERARLIIDFDKEKEYTLEYDVWKGKWIYSTQNYFRERGLGYTFRQWCCLPADPFPYTLNRINKISALKEIDFTSDLFKHGYVNSVVIHSWKRADLYEKLCKVDMKDMIKDDLESYYGHELKIDNTQTSLIKMLELNKNTFRMLKSHQSIDALNYLKKHPDISDKAFEKAYLLGFSDRLQKKTAELGIKFGKAFSYIQKHSDGKGFVTDYIDYLETLNKLGYPIDNQYCFPKNFRKEDARIQKEYRDREARRNKMTPLEKIKEEARVDAVINKISMLLRENEELKRWMVGSNGLKVIVPQSVGELTDEGIKLHNCLSTYANKIADKQTLIFFIRKLNDPNKEFIAMEYRNGKVQQLRLDNNKPVEDKNIIQFANAFAGKLNQLDIVNEIRRAA